MITQEQLNNALFNTDRVIDVKIEIGEVTLTNEDIIEFSIEKTLGNGNVPMIGGVGSNTFTSKILNVNLPSSITTQKITPYVGIYVREEIEWFCLGVFYPNQNKITKDELATTISGAFDRLALFEKITYTSELIYPSSMKLVCEEIATKTSLQFEDLTPFQLIVVNENPSGKGIRTILSDLAVLSSTNCTMTKDDTVKFITYTSVERPLTGDNYIEVKKLKDEPVKFSKLRVTFDANKVYTEEEEVVDNYIEYGDNTGTTIGFFSNNVLSDSELIEIYNRFMPLTYLPTTIESQGMPQINCGDIITINLVNGEVISLPLAYHRLTYNGGLVSTFTSNAPSNETDIGTLGDGYFTKLTKNFNNTITNLNTSTINKINDMKTEITEDYETLVKAENGNILTEVKETYSEKSEVDSLVKTLSTQIQQNAEDIEFNFNSAKEYSTQINDETKAEIEEFRKYIRFDNSGIEIGSEGSKFLSKFSDIELGFYYGTTKIAYISKDRLYIPESIEVGENLTVGTKDTGKFTWRVRDNGHFTLRVGD